MKFSKPGRIVLALLVTLGVSLGITSCSSDYTIGFLYVTGTSVANPTSGQISAFKISNNTGALTPVTDSPFGTSGENPRRALIYSKTARFFYVLNGGDATTGAGGGIALFFIGGDGGLSFQSTYASQGTGPVTIVSDAGGTHLYEIDEYAPSTATPCLDASGVAHPVGAVTAFTVDQNTGRLSLVTNSQQRDANGTNLTYFPLGCFPIDAATAAGNLYTIEKGSTAIPEVFIYGEGATGQLTLTSNAPQLVGDNMTNLTAISVSGSSVYLLDAGPSPTTPGNPSYIYPYTASGTGGALAITSTGRVTNDPSVGDPVALLVEATTHSFVYVANAAVISTAGTTAYSDISAFNQINGELTLFTTDEPFQTGASPRCIVEDPSNQYIYTADHDSNTVTGRIIDTVHGTLQPLHNGATFASGGNPTWCVVTGRTQ